MKPTRGNGARPAMSVRQTLSLFKEQTLQQLRVNMKTQAVWPREVYPGDGIISPWGFEKACPSFDVSTLRTELRKKRKE